jgi:hypothetical protein
MGTLTISMAIFHSYVTNYQRVQCSRHLWCSRHFKTRLVDDYMDIMGLYSIPSGCVKIAVENSHRNGWWIPIKNGDFLNSYVAVYQRVRPPTCDFNVFKTGAWTTNQSGCWFQQLLIWIHMILWIVVIYYVFFSWDGRIVMSRLLNWQTCKLKPLKWDGLVGATWWHKWHPTIMATDTIEKSCYLYLFMRWCSIFSIATTRGAHFGVRQYLDDIHCHVLPWTCESPTFQKGLECGFMGLVWFHLSNGLSWVYVSDLIFTCIYYNYTFT